MKLTIGPQACPWLKAELVYPVAEGGIVPATMVLARDVSDPENWHDHVSLFPGKLYADAGNLFWKVFEDWDGQDPGYDVLLWHDPDVVLDVWRLQSTMSFLDKNPLQSYAAPEWQNQFLSVWKKRPWMTFAPTNQYGDQIGWEEDLPPSEGVTSSAQVAALHLENFKKGLEAGGLDKWKQLIQATPGKVIPMDVDYMGYPPIKMPFSDGTMPMKSQTFMGFPIILDETMGPDEFILGGVKVQYLDQGSSYGLSTMPFPDGVLRPVLLAWQMLRGPGNMWTMDAKKSVLQMSVVQEYDTPIATSPKTMIYRGPLQQLYDEHIKKFGVKPQVILSGGLVKPFLYGLDAAMDRLFIRMGLPNKAVVKIPEYSEASFPGNGKFHVKGVAQIPWLGPELIEFDEKIS